MKKTLCKRIAVVLILGMLIVGVAGCQSNASAVLDEVEYQSQSKDSVVNEKTMDKLVNIERLIAEHYFFEEDDQAKQEGIIRGYIDSLGDPYSCYYTPEEYANEKEWKTGNTGTFGGMVFSFNDDNELVIGLVYGPAKEAGIMVGDVVIKVDGEDIRSLDNNTVMNKFQNFVGTEVPLTIYRSFNQKEYNFTISGQIVEMPAVEYQMLDNNIGYIEVFWFHGYAAEQYFQALVDLKSQGMEGLIVDLRDNTGGDLAITATMLDFMLPAGKSFYKEDKNGNVEEYNSTDAYKFEKPLVILINGNSASASEVFAGAIKDYEMGTIIGEKTFGKGIVQRIFQFADGSAVKLTTSKWFTPNGNCIHNNGIKPDEEVTFDKKAYIESGGEKDNQLQAAIDNIMEKLGKKQ